MNLPAVKLKPAFTLQALFGAAVIFYILGYCKGKTTP
ncbi:cobalt transport protein CbiN [Salmonella enterica subsp. enterica]|nr:cobalt transport protein CbiN [Salmonella enterica subsp. enterica]